MEKLNRSEQKKILLNILKYIDNICRSNDIHYSAIGGTAIGTIRNGGMIPWDDDIDIILLHDDYVKLLECLKKLNNSEYEVKYPGCSKDYYYPFVKVIDKKTKLIEENIKQIDNYGIFIDIFEYNKAPDDEKKREKYWKKLQFYRTLIVGYSKEKIPKSEKNRLIKKIRGFIAKRLNISKLVNKYLEHCHKFNNTNNNSYLISNWPVYSIKKETQKSENMNEYMDKKFENLNIMISKKYDNILKNTFGDYMTPPPKEKQINHGLNVQWR